MGFFSVTFLVLSYQLTSFFGPVGFILANCTNMLLRIVYSGLFIHKQYQSVQLHPLEGIIPKKFFAISLITVGILCKISEVKQNDVWQIFDPLDLSWIHLYFSLFYFIIVHRFVLNHIRCLVILPSVHRRLSLYLVCGHLRIKISFEAIYTNEIKMHRNLWAIQLQNENAMITKLAYSIRY